MYHTCEDFHQYVLAMPFQSIKLADIFLISVQKRMLWVLIRSDF